jgi:hypothetical protein
MSNLIPLNERTQEEKTKIAKQKPMAYNKVKANIACNKKKEWKQ